ncbi:MAG: porin family protein, partial [Massilibacteroides sp.]|nr:porin family protein [Massilibacteroides sp.]
MKKGFLLFVFVIVVSTIYAQKGKTSAGFTLGHAFDSENVVAGLDLRYNITDEVRLAPALSHFIKNDGVSAWAVDVNAHYVFQMTDMFGFYPLGGVGLAFWDFGGNGENRFGLNVGLGGELYATRDVTVGLEMKYN